MEKELNLEQIQGELLCMLEFFDRLCVKFNLQYCLFGGSLLGAIRHQHFIPWDDDLDVAMPRDDYDKLISSKTINDYIQENGFSFLSNKTCRYYHNEFGKLIDYSVKVQPNNKPFSFVEKIGLFIDVFPIDNYLESMKMQKKCRKMMFISERRRINPFSCFKSNYPFRTKFKFFVKSVIWKFYYLYPAKKKFKKINSINGYLNCAFVSCNASFDYIGRCVNKSAFFPTNEKLMFGTKKYYVPNDYIAVVKMLYGESFMTPPPIEKRVSNHEFTFIKDS